jgi:hypothetical protein
MLPHRPKQKHLRPECIPPDQGKRTSPLLAAGPWVQIAPLVRSASGSGRRGRTPPPGTSMAPHTARPCERISFTTQNPIRSLIEGTPGEQFALVPPCCTSAGRMVPVLRYQRRPGTDGEHAVEMYPVGEPAGMYRCVGERMT